MAETCSSFSEPVEQVWQEAMIRGIMSMDSDRRLKKIMFQCSNTLRQNVKA